APPAARQRQVHLPAGGGDHRRRRAHGQGRGGGRRGRGAGPAPERQPAHRVHQPQVRGGHGGGGYGPHHHPGQELPRRLAPPGHRRHPYGGPGHRSPPGHGQPPDVGPGPPGLYHRHHPGRHRQQHRGG